MQDFGEQVPAQLGPAGLGHLTGQIVAAEGEQRSQTAEQEHQEAPVINRRQ